MLRAGFEPAIPVTKRPQTYILDRAAIGIGTADVDCTVLSAAVAVSDVCVCVCGGTKPSAPAVGERSAVTAASFPPTSGAAVLTRTFMFGIQERHWTVDANCFIMHLLVV
jgi:hypothetical protein